jgi:hypothetical protein
MVWGVSKFSLADRKDKTQRLTAEVRARHHPEREIPQYGSLSVDVP